MSNSSNSQQRTMREGLNLNTVLLAIILGLSSWTLKKVSDQGEMVATLNAKVQNLERVVYSRAE